MTALLPEDPVALSPRPRRQRRVRLRRQALREPDHHPGCTDLDQGR